MTTVQEFYNRYNYLNPRNYALAKEVGKKITVSGCAPSIFVQHPFRVERPVDGSIMIAGCGTVEACLVANVNPAAHVVAIDFSKASIAISKSIARHHKIKNIRHMVGDICDIEIPQKFDYVVSSGVLHHIPDVSKALCNIKNHMNDNGILSGMVYYKTERKAIDKNIVDYFRKNNYHPTDVMQTLKSVEHPWYSIHVKDMQEIADTWLHPYYVEYEPQDLYTLLKHNGFTNIEVFTTVDSIGKLFFKASV